jgi:hypothetical protein
VLIRGLRETGGTGKMACSYPLFLLKPLCPKALTILDTIDTIISIKRFMN